MQDDPLKDLEKRLVVALEWKEHGWGERPDGYSLHLDQESCEKYVRDYWAGMPDQAPVDFEAPHGSSFPLFVSQELYERVKESESGIRLYKSDPAYGRIIITKSLER